MNEKSDALKRRFFHIDLIGRSFILVELIVGPYDFIPISQ